MIAKYPGTCQDCGSRFDAGAEIRGYAGRDRVYRHVTCPQQQTAAATVAPTVEQQRSVTPAAVRAAAAAELASYEAMHRAALKRNDIPADGYTAKQVHDVFGYVQSATKGGRHELDEVDRKHVQWLAEMALWSEDRDGYRRHSQGDGCDPRSLVHKFALGPRGAARLIREEFG